MVPLSNVSPVKWGILALEGALWRGFTLGEMAVPCLVLLGVGVTGFAVGARLFRD
jgi:ABC-2 type transport system permease protein